jgi:hypothetical protein
MINKKIKLAFTLGILWMFASCDKKTTTPTNDSNCYTCNCNSQFVGNGQFGIGAVVGTDYPQDNISQASAWFPLFSGSLAKGEYYQSNNEDYAGLWLHNGSQAKPEFREGIQNQLSTSLTPNSGLLNLKLKVRKDPNINQSWGENVELHIYGIKQGVAIQTFPSEINTSNENLYGSASTQFIASFTFNASTLSSSYQQLTSSLNTAALNFPIGTLLITRGNCSGAVYIDIDDVSLCSPTVTVNCQNTLVYNAGFENAQLLYPNHFGQDNISEAVGWQPLFSTALSKGECNRYQGPSAPISNSESGQYYASMWVHPGTSTVSRQYREGIQTTLLNALDSNKNYSLCMQLALSPKEVAASSQTLKIGIYGIRQGVGMTSFSNSGNSVVNTLDLYGPNNCILLKEIEIDLNTMNANGTFTTYSTSIPATVIPYAIDKIFITRTDNNIGQAYMAFDNISIKPL